MDSAVSSDESSSPRVWGPRVVKYRLMDFVLLSWAVPRSVDVHDHGVSGGCLEGPDWALQCVLLELS